MPICVRVAWVTPLAQRIYSRRSVGPVAGPTSGYLANREAMLFTRGRFFSA